MSVTVTFNGTLTVSGDETRTVALAALSNTLAVGGGESIVALTTGFNAVPVPAGAIAGLIVPSSGSANTKTLKGITGDTGIAMNPPNAPALIPVSGLSTLGITSAGAETLKIYWI